MAQFEHHVFVCENTRPTGHPRGCCSSRGGSEVRAQLKKLIYERGLKGMVRVNKAGCLDQCERGVTVVIYPQGLWYGGVAVEDVPAIVDALEQGSQVEHLVIADEDLTGRARSET